MRKIAIIMTCFNRQDLCENSINSILSYGYKELEIVVVDDASDEPFVYNHEKVHIVRVEKRDKKWINPVVTYNIGINYVMDNFTPDIIVLQNAESFHYGDILSHINENLTSDDYFSYACMSVDESFGKVSAKKIAEICDSIQCAAFGDIEMGWYNHSVLYPRAYDFCSAIYTANLKTLNGFDERFDKHVWYGDDNFAMRVRKLGLKVSIIDEPFVVHQWHSRSHQPHGYTEASLMLFNKTIQEDTFVAKHKHTKNIY